MNYFDNHTTLALLGLAVFPRTTLLFASFSTGGLLYWISWLIAPRILIAVLAIPYIFENPFLVLISWVFAFEGTKFEGRISRKSFN